MSYDPLQEAAQNLQARENAKTLYDSNAYHLEKITGKRTATGALKLKRLKPEHRHIIALHLKGHSNRDIAFLLDRDEITISRVLHDPLAEELIHAHAAGIEKELEALSGMAVDALRRGLLDKDVRINLKASDQFFSAIDKHKQRQAGGGTETAEDVISRALKVMDNQAGAIRELTRPTRPRALDIDFEEVNEDGNKTKDNREDQQRVPLLELGHSDGD